MLTRWDPFREMLSIRNNMERMFDSALAGSPDRWQPWPGTWPWTWLKARTNSW